MSDDVNKEEKKEPIDIDTLTKNINDSVEKNLEKNMREFQDNFEQKFKPKDKDEYEPPSYDDDEEDSFVTKADLKEFGKTIADRIVKDSKKISEETFSSKTNKLSRDGQAMKDFPLLNPESKDFDRDFSEQVKKEISRRVNTGTGHDHPDLVYDAATSIERQWIHQGKYIPKTIAEKYVKDTQNETSGNFSGKFKTGSKNDKPSARQNELAKEWGVDPKYIRNPRN